MADPAVQNFPDPGADATVADAWETFQSGAEPPPGVLRSLVDGSWHRCAEARVDPYRRSGPQPVSEQDLYLLRERRRALLEASAPVMACARDYLTEAGTLMALADTSGTVLATEGDCPTLALAETIRLMPGARWSETLCGTNAIGTTLATGQPVQIHSAEHFCAGIKRWTCTATVVRRPTDGEVVGAIDLSGLSSTFNRQSLALVVTTANRIEGRLLIVEMERRVRLLDQALGSWPAAGADAAVLFDRRGHPIKSSDHARIAIADAGGALDLAAIHPIPALGANPLGRGAQARLPDWIRPEWLKPMVVDGEHLGTLMLLPAMPRRRSVLASPAKVASRGEPVATPAADAFSAILTGDPAMCELIARAALLAPSQAPVLLQGETGAGKEEFARGLHGERAGPCIVLNCGGLSRDLMASELFGYAEGAFTGARKGGMVGKIEAAQGGTLFLDELGEMPLDMQPQLLRVLERHEVQRLGETTPRQVDFRLVAATHRDLRQEVAAGRFRMDLFYRVAVTCLHIPPLRERRGDILLLARHFLAQFRQAQGRVAEALSPQVQAALLAGTWPGNVRELRNAIEGAVLLSPAGPIDLTHLAVDSGSLDGLCPRVDELVPPPLPSMAQSEEALIARAVVASCGNLSLAARRLNIAKSTLYAKLRLYGLNRDGSRTPAP